MILKNIKQYYNLKVLMSMNDLNMLFETINKNHGISFDLKHMACIIGISASKANKIFMDYTENK